MKNREISIALKGCIAAILIFIILILAFFLNTDKKAAQSSSLVEQVSNRLEKQQMIDKQLATELDSNEYSPETPLLVQNPYNVSPLTALAIFTTREPTEITISIEGKNKYSDVNFTFKGFTTQHQIPIYGLYPGQKNNIKFIVRSKNDKVDQYYQTLTTEPLPTYLQNLNIDIIQSNPQLYSPGMNFTYEHTDPIFKKEAFDINGDIRWYLNDSSINLLSKTTLYSLNEHNLVLYGDYHYGDVIITEQDLLGKIYRVWSSPYGSHHDIAKLPNGNFLIAGSDNRNTVEDIISEIDVLTGKTINILDLKSILDYRRPALAVSNSKDIVTDWLHINSIVTDAGGKNIIISNRHQASVVKLTYPEGKIKWILGSHDNYLPKYRKYLLTPVGNDFEWQWGQHAPYLLPDLDNNSDTTDILLFDNGNNKSFDADKAVLDKDNYSRMVWYRIDEKKMTIEQIWQYGKEKGNDLFSYRCGSATLLENGNFLGSFNVLTHREYNEYIEVNQAKDIVFEASLTTKDGSDIYDYRITRRELYTQIDADFDVKIQPHNFILLGNE